MVELIGGHIFWNPATVSPKTARRNSRRNSRNATVRLAHFHLGGNFGWGNRFPGHCPITYANKLGIAVCSTVHSVVHPFEGSCGPQRPLWFKLALQPIAWAGNMQSLASVRREIAVSQHDAGKLRRWYWPLRGKVVALYHSRLRAGSQPRLVVNREPLVLSVGHIAWRKGQLVLAEAFALIRREASRRWKLCFAGPVLEESTAEKIREIARANKLEDRILLLGERQDAFDLMRQAGIYVQPSYQEALGLALQEALFLGCASIGTRAGGIPELVEHERTGLLVDPGHPPPMARAMETIMSNPQCRPEPRQRGAASIVPKGMTAEQMVANHVALYESILRDA